MTAERTNIVICPQCGAENIEGTDTCENCLQDLRTVDVPDTVRVGSRSDFLDPIVDLRVAPPRTVPVSATTGEAVGMLRDSSAGAVVVMDDDLIVGIFTERDLLKKVAGISGTFERPVTDFMTPDPVVLREDDTAATALNKMGVGGFRHIPVVHEGKLAGVLSGRDVMNWLITKYLNG